MIFLKNIYIQVLVCRGAQLCFCFYYIYIITSTKKRNKIINSNISL